MGCKFCFAILTHWRRLCLEQSTGLLPLTISSRSTPNANTSVFSSTTPCIKYSGAKYLIQIQIWFNFYQAQYSNNHRLHLSKCSKFISYPCFNNSILKCFFFNNGRLTCSVITGIFIYPKVPSIGSTEWWLHCLGSHFANPKSEIYIQKRKFLVRRSTCSTD